MRWKGSLQQGLASLRYSRTQPGDLIHAVRPIVNRTCFSSPLVCFAASMSCVLPLSYLDYLEPSKEERLFFLKLMPFL